MLLITAFLLQLKDMLSRMAGKRQTYMQLKRVLQFSENIIIKQKNPMFAV